MNPFERRTTLSHDDEDYDDDFRIDEPDDDTSPVLIRPLHQIFLDALIEADEAATLYRPHTWMRKWAARQQDARCAYCSAPVSVAAKVLPGQAFVDLLVPVAAGGIANVENVVLCCPTCKSLKGAKDWLGFAKAFNRKAITAQRVKALMLSDNHVLPLSVKTRGVALDTFAKRFASPRFRVSAGVYQPAGFFAWDKDSLANARNGELLAQLRFGFGGKNLSTDRWGLFEVPRDRWHEAAWDLIEQNALLTAVEMSDVEEMTYPAFTHELEDEHKERWFVRLPGERWLKEVRRVARWSTQAKPVRQAIVTEQAVANKRRPFEDAMRAINEAFNKEAQS